LIKTDFFITLEWDGWVIDPDMWSDEFLQYDFVGAPWWYEEDELNVGNGLALRSVQLMRYLADHRNVLPVDTAEDATLCRVYRPVLERHGFKWPTEQVASRFAFECSRPSPDSRHFMFHGPFNFPAVLAGARLKERMRLIEANEYILATGKNVWAEDACKIIPRLAA
jgi:hypothetical protein